jgi:hypothetical protein
LLLMVFFAGGAVWIGSKDSGGRKVSGFLCNAGSNFFRSFRTFLVFLVLLVFWTFFVGRVGTWLPRAFSEGGNETALFRRELLLTGLWLLGVLTLLFLRRLALARLVLADRGSAILAFFSSLWFLFRHPLALLLSFFGLCALVSVVLLGGSFLVDRFEAVEASALPVFLAGQFVFVTIHASLLASFALAARVWELDQSPSLEEEALPPLQPTMSPSS